ncbi:MAG: FadR/GntR family transcriptional regulator [Nocardioidaceae bacterium]
MSIRLVPLERAKTYELVVRRLKAEIFAGRLRPGDRLPGERQLSEQLQVSRPSVREAMRILQAMEIVRSGPGSTSELVVSAQPSRALADLLGIHVALSSYTVAEVMSVRMALEEQSVRRLAERVDDADLATVADTLKRMSEPGLDRGTFHDLDTEFHVALARGSDNSLLADLMAALRESVRRPMDEAFADDREWPNRQEALVTEHVEIFEAVRAGDVDLAAALMRRHIEGFYDSLGIDQPATGEAPHSS